MNKKYIIEVATDPASLKRLRDQLEQATQLPKDGVEVPELSRSSKAQIKRDLATMFGVAEYQAEALQKMMQAAVDGFADGKSVDEMKNRLKETLEFTEGIMQNMQKLGSATSWMDQGITFVDDFIKMKDSLGAIKEVEKSVTSLGKTFEKFKDALAETNADAFLQRFGPSTRSDAKEFAAAQKEIEKLAKKRHKKVSAAIASGQSEEFDYTGYDKATLEEEYRDAIRIIKESNKEIADLRKAYKGKSKDLYNDTDYLDAVSNLSMALKQIDHMHGVGDNVGSEVSASMQIATESVKEAGNEIKNLVKKLQGDGIELAVKLPDASSEKFTSQISDFINKATEEFKSKPIEVPIEIISSFKKEAYDKNGELKALSDFQADKSQKTIDEYKKRAQGEGLDVNEEDLIGLKHQNVHRIARNTLDAFNKMHGVVTSGQKLLTSAAKSWREQMEKEFTVKPKFDTEKAKEDIRTAIGEIQDEFDKSDDESASFWVTAKPDARNFIKDLQNALIDQSVTVDVKAGKIDASGATIDTSNARLSGDVPPDGGSGPTTPPASGTPKAPIVPKEPEATPAPEVKENSTVVSESTRVQTVLNESIRQLNAHMEVNSKRIERIKAEEGLGDPDEIIKSATAAMAEMEKVRSRAVERKKQIDEQLKTETDSTKFDSLTMEKRDLEAALDNQWKTYIKLDNEKRAAEARKEKQKNGEPEEEKKSRTKKYEDENKVLGKYKKAIEKVLENDENPAKLIVDELKTFWKSVQKNISEAEEAGDIEKLNRWTQRASAMTLKGLDITKTSEDGKTIELLDDDEAIKIVEGVLKRNKSLGGDLLQDSTLKSLSGVKRMGYYTSQVQKAMGVIPQSTEAEERTKGLNESFKSALKLNEYIKIARSLLKDVDKDVDPASIQKFIEYFGHFPEMADSIEYAKSYLAEMQGVTGEPWKDKNQKTYQEQMSEIWGTLDADNKAKFLDALNKSDAANGKTITNLSDFSDDGIYKIVKSAFQEEGSAFRQLTTENPQLSSILSILQRSTLLDSTRKSSKVFESDRRDGKPASLLSSLYGIQKDSGTIHITTIGRDNLEKVLELNGGKTATESDKRFTYAPKSMDRLARVSGKQKEFNELVEAMFDPAILVRDRLEAEVRTMERNLNSLKLGHPHPDTFKGTDLEEGFRKVDIATQLNNSLRNYILNDHEIDDLLFNSFKELRHESNISSIVDKLKNGEVPGYLEKQLEGLTGEERTAAIQAELAQREAELSNIRKNNHAKAIETLAASEQRLKQFRTENQEAILNLIKVEEQALEAKRKELDAARAAAVQAEKNVEAKSQALFTDQFRLSANKEAATPLWAQEEQFDKTPLGVFNAEEKRLKKAIEAHEKPGAMSQMVQNVMKWTGASADEARKKVLAQLEKELKELLANPPSEDDIKRSLLVREMDIERAKARSGKEASKSSKRERASERLSEEDDKGAYKRARDAQKKAARDSDYHLEGLLSRISFAGEHGLMDTSELDGLASEYKSRLAAVMQLPMRGPYMSTSEMATNEGERKINDMIDAAHKSYQAWEAAQKEFSELTAKLQTGAITEQEYKASGVEDRLNTTKAQYIKDRDALVKGGIAKDANEITPETIKAAKDAYDELGKAKTALIDKFFDTKGWNVARKLQDELGKYDGKFADEERRIRESATNNNSGINEEIGKIQKSEASAKAAADRYAESLVDTYIREPQYQVEKAVRDRTSEVEAIKTDAIAKKDALQLRVQDGNYLNSQITEIEKERSKNFDLNRIAEKRSRVAGIDKAIALIDGPLKEISDAYYSDEEVKTLMDSIRKMEKNGQKNTDEYVKALNKLSDIRRKYISDFDTAIMQAMDSSIDKAGLVKERDKMIEDGKKGTDRFKVIEDRINGRTEAYNNPKYDRIQKEIREKYIEPGFRDYLKYVQKEFSGKIHRPDSDLEHQVLSSKKSELLASLDGSDAIVDEINAGYDARIAAVKHMAESDKTIHDRVRAIESEWKKEATPIENEMRGLRGQEGGMSSDRYKELTAQYAQVNTKYNQAIREAQEAWIKEQEVKIDAAAQDMLVSLSDGSYDTSGSFAEFNKLATQTLGREINAKTYAEIESIVKEIKEKAYQAAAAKAAEAMKNLDRSKGVTPEEIDSRVEAARKENEANKMAAAALLRTKTDAEVMAMYNEEAASNLDKASEESRAHAQALKKEQEEDMKRHGITDQMLATARENAVLSGEMAEIRKVEKKAVEEQASATETAHKTSTQQSGGTTPSGGATPSGGSYRPSNQGGGYFATIDTSKLAQEATLRGIYTLLNGAPPEGGWGDTQNNSDNQNVWPARANGITSDGTFAQSIKALILASTKIDKEVATLIGNGNILSAISSGWRGSLDPKDINLAIKNEPSQVDYVLHNHSNSKRSSYLPSLGDYRAAAGWAARRRSFGSGSYNKDGVALIDFSNVPTSKILNDILQQAINDWLLLAKSKGMTITTDVNGEHMTYDTINGSKTPEELRQIHLGLYESLTKMVADRFREAGYDDVVKTFTYDEISQMAQTEVDISQAQDVKNQIAKEIINGAVEMAKAYYKGEYGLLTIQDHRDIADIPLQEMQQRVNKANYYRKNGLNVFDRRNDQFGTFLNNIYRLAPEETFTFAEVEQILKIAGGTETPGIDNMHWLTWVVEDVIAKRGGTPEVNTQSAQTAVEQVAEAIVEAGAQAAIESSSTTKNGIDIARDFYSKLGTSGKQLDHMSNKMVEDALKKAFGLDTNSNDFYFSGSKGDRNVLDPAFYLDKYKAFDNILQLIGYHLDEIKPNMIDVKNQSGFRASIVKNASGSIVNIDEARKILFGAINGDSDVETKPAQQAVTQVAETIVEAGAQAAIESAKSANLSKADIGAKQTEFQKKFKTKELKSGKKGFEIDGANKIDQAMYNVGDRLTKDTLTDQDLGKLTTAYSQLENAFKEEIINHLDKETIDFLNELKRQISSVLGANYSKLSAKSQQSTSIKEAKAYLSNLKGDDGKIASGASRASTGIDQVYDVLSKGKAELTNADLTSVAQGYYRLQETVNHAVFEKLDENTKKVINDVIQEAKAVLDKHGVTVQSKELVGTVLDDASAKLFTNANSKDKKKKSGRVISSVSEPQVMRNGEIISNASVYLSEAKKKNAQETATSEARTTQEQQKQNQLATEGVQKAEQAAAATESQAKAAEKVTEAYRTALTKESVTEVKGKLDQFTQTKDDGTVTKQAGIVRAKRGISNVYSVLSKGDTKLDGENLDTLKTGYRQLVETTEHAIFQKFDEQTKQILIQAKNEALEVLSKYGVDLSSGGTSGGATNKGTSSGGTVGSNNNPLSSGGGGSSGGNQGGLLGLLGRIAQESTLQSVLAQLSKGIKTTSDKDGGKKNKDTDEEKAALSKDEATEKLKEYINANYKGAGYDLGAVETKGNGYAIKLTQQKDNSEALKEANAELAKCEVGTEAWFTALKKVNMLQAEIEQITVRINAETGKITVNSTFKNLAVGAKAAAKELQYVDDIMQTLHSAGALSFDANGTPTSSNQSVTNYINSLKKLQDFTSGKTQEELYNPANQAILSNLTLAVQNYRKEVTGLLGDLSKYNSGTKIGEITGGLAGLEGSDIKKSMQDIIAQSTDLEATFGKLTPVTNELDQVVSYQLAYSLRIGKREVQEMTASLDPLTGELKVQKGAIKEVATGWDQFWAGLKGKFSSIIQYIASITSIQDIIRYVREGFQYVREIDTALTELKKVTDETDASYSQFLQTMSKTGAVVGATVTDLTKSAADWARLNI